MFIQFLRPDGRNNNSNKNIKLQIKSFLKKTHCKKAQSTDKWN